MLLSIVLPAFNEENRIIGTLDEVVSYGQKCAHDLEVIVVDDGSTDSVSDVARSYESDISSLSVIRHETNRGKGRAVATGMLAARGSYRAFFDADGATPIAEVAKLLDSAVANPWSVAIGSIRVKGTEVTRPQPWARALAGKAGTAFIRAAVLPGVRDSQRGCKLFPAPVADTVFAALQVDGWAFDIEVLALCQRLGHKIIEVPVTWHHVGGGQIRASSYLTTLAEVVRIRRMLRADAHNLVAPAKAGRVAGYVEQTTS